jgi:hypothetical protein
MALDADRKNGPAARSFAADAHDCIMVRIKRPYRIQVCGTKMCPNGELPSDPQQTDRHRPDAEAMQKAPVAVHRRCACSGVKALRNTSAARRQAAKLCYRFGPFDPFRALREPDRRRRDEERLSRSEQRTGSTTQNNRLTGKAPYKFESCSLQRGVCCELDCRRRDRHPYGSRSGMQSQPRAPISSPPPCSERSSR